MARAEPVEVAFEPRLDVDFGRKTKQFAREPGIGLQHMHIARARIGVDGLEVGRAAQRRR